jgi:hypothetical protein
MRWHYQFIEKYIYRRSIYGGTCEVALPVKHMMLLFKPQLYFVVDEKKENRLNGLLMFATPGQRRECINYNTAARAHMHSQIQQTQHARNVDILAPGYPSSVWLAAAPGGRRARAMCATYRCRDGGGGSGSAVAAVRRRRVVVAPLKDAAVVASDGDDVAVAAREAQVHDVCACMRQRHATMVRDESMRSSRVML